jgi:aryl-alcohol dehydrogenase-like predicted oxidoreductase
VIGLGAWQFGSPEWGWGNGFGPAEAQAIVERARQLGVTLIDTAEIYGRGESERVLGRILAARDLRDAFVLASKVAPTWPTRERVKAAAARAAEIVLADDEFLHLNQAADRFHRDTLVSVGAMATARARTLLGRR